MNATALAIKNIIKYTKRLNLTDDENELEFYIKYLSYNTGISEYRMRKILMAAPSTRLSIGDLVLFADVFKIRIVDFFKEDD